MTYGCVAVIWYVCEPAECPFERHFAGENMVLLKIWTCHSGEWSKICHIHSDHSEEMPCQNGQQLPLSTSHVVLMSKHARQTPLPLYCRHRPLQVSLSLSYSIQVAHYFSFWEMLAWTLTLKTLLIQENCERDTVINFWTLNYDSYNHKKASCFSLSISAAWIQHNNKNTTGAFTYGLQSCAQM